MYAGGCLFRHLFLYANEDGDDAAVTQDTAVYGWAKVVVASLDVLEGEKASKAESKKQRRKRMNTKSAREK